MDTPSVPAPTQSQNSPKSTSPATSPFVSFKNKIKNLTRKQKIILAVIALVILILVISLILLFRQNSSNDSKVIAKVGGEAVPNRYLNLEFQYYPSTRSAEVDQKLTQKVIDDEIILQSAKKEGLISSYPSGANLSPEDYLKRTAEVENVKKMIEERKNGITVDLVSIWFYNTAPPPIGYARALALAKTKITSLYERVKNKEITIKQAGEIIAADTELAGLDRAYKENAYTQIKAVPGEQITFWPELSDILWDLPLDGLTPIYTGTDTDLQGKVIPILYTFGQVTEIVSDSNISNFGEWFNKQKESLTITYE